MFTVRGTGYANLADGGVQFILDGSGSPGDVNMMFIGSGRAGNVDIARAALWRNGVFPSTASVVCHGDYTGLVVQTMAYYRGVFQLSIPNGFYDVNDTIPVNWVTKYIIP
jgi:hypothetical protein